MPAFPLPDSAIQFAGQYRAARRFAFDPSQEFPLRRLTGTAGEALADGPRTIRAGVECDHEGLGRAKVNE